MPPRALNTQQALRWIARALTAKNVPFQAVGGLAARAYGATRPIADLDFYMPMARYPDIRATVEPYVVRPPRRHHDGAWDITFAQLIYKGQKIELGGAEDAYFFDRQSGRWTAQRIDFSNSRWMTVLGTKLPVMPKDDLIAYKRMLDREVDRLDLAEIAGSQL